MIVYDLECRNGSHRFEGWFKSSDDFAEQQESGLISCPYCGSIEVAKAVQAPRLTRKGNQLPATVTPRRDVQAPASHPEMSTPLANIPLPPQAVELIHKLAQVQAETLKTSRYVGDSFAEDARAMHYGERETETIHGQATPKQAQELLEEGIAVVPLPFAVLPPEQAN